MKKFEKNTKGITLIALVITIIVLVIVSSVGIYLSLGNNGIFTKAQESKEKTQRETATEKINLKITTAQMNSYAENQEIPTLKELSLILKEDSEISYVTEESKVASAEYNVPSENPSAIYTKLKDYDYEFGINSSLQLASIDGVKVAENENNNETINSIIARLEALEKKSNANSFTLLGTLTGMGSETSNYLEIPECDEIVVCVDYKNVGTDIYTLTIPYEEINSGKRMYRSGSYIRSNNNAGVVVTINNGKIYLAGVIVISQDYTSTSTMRVYYK